MSTHRAGGQAGYMHNTHNTEEVYKGRLQYRLDQKKDMNRLAKIIHTKHQHT